MRLHARLFSPSPGAIFSSSSLASANPCACCPTPPSSLRSGEIRLLFPGNRKPLRLLPDGRFRRVRDLEWLPPPPSSRASPAGERESCRAPACTTSSSSSPLPPSRASPAGGRESCRAPARTTSSLFFASFSRLTRWWTRVLPLRCARCFLGGVVSLRTLFPSPPPSTEPLPEVWRRPVVLPRSASLPRLGLSRAAEVGGPHRGGVRAARRVRTVDADGCSSPPTRYAHRFGALLRIPLPRCGCQRHASTAS